MVASEEAFKATALLWRIIVLVYYAYINTPAEFQTSFVGPRCVDAWTTLQKICFAPYPFLSMTRPFFIKVVSKGSTTFHL